jgi:asparagine synthase (glutamine-hydrolysing)
VYRYLALIWNPSDERSRATSIALTERLTHEARWNRALNEPGAAIFDTGQHPGSSDTLPLASSGGAVLGRLFSRQIEDPVSAARVTFDNAESSQVVASGGCRLFERYWGRYVAIVRNSHTGEVWVLRDPSGGFPCWLVVHEGVAIVCSDIDDCHALQVVRFTVNWNYIAGFVAYPGLQTRPTALNEVSEVQPGERLRFSSGTLQRSIQWDPIEIARSAPIESYDETVASLRTTAIGCIHAWAAGSDAILHNLSGGLDSSIVLSALMSAPSRPRVVCLNYFGTGPNEDERHYARLMAGHAGAELVEYQLDPHVLRLQDLLSLRRSPRPWFYVYELEHGRYEGELAGRYGADSLFSGAGGDGVFFQARAELAVTDYLFQHGLRAGLLRTAIDAARMSRKSIWPLLWQALRARLFEPPWDPAALAKPFARSIVNNDLLVTFKRDESFAHPWLTPEATRGVPPGILWHVMSVSLPPAYYSAFHRGPYPERTLPLLSQPLVELCLRFPTYLLITSGLDRALARRAFANDLPAEIARRSAKGRTDQHVRNILDANIGFIREMLLDGLMVQRGLLNREALELYLTRERSPADFQYSEILQEHLCTEAWLRTWVTTSSAAAG